MSAIAADAPPVARALESQAEVALYDRKWDLGTLKNLSPSAVWSFIQCPECFRLAYIEKQPTPTSVHLLIGRFVHESTARLRQQLLQGLTPFTDDCIDAGADAFDRIIQDQLAPLDEEKTDEAAPIREIELTDRYKDVGQAKDHAVKITRFALPKIADYDAQAGVVAAEARVWHLGRAIPAEAAREEGDAEDFEAEAREQVEQGLLPPFPFPVKAYLDVLYSNGALKDLKTAGRMAPPDNLARLQLLLYGMPFWWFGEACSLGFDVASKTATPDFGTYWLQSRVNPELPPGQVSDDEYRYARWRVLQAAEDISAGRFNPNDGSLFHRYLHGLPDAQRAASFPGDGA